MVDMVEQIQSAEKAASTVVGTEGRGPLAGTRTEKCHHLHSIRNPSYEIHP